MEGGPRPLLGPFGSMERGLRPLLGLWRAFAIYGGGSEACFGSFWVYAWECEASFGAYRSGSEASFAPLEGGLGPPLGPMEAAPGPLLGPLGLWKGVRGLFRIYPWGFKASFLSSLPCSKKLRGSQDNLKAN